MNFINVFFEPEAEEAENARRPPTAPQAVSVTPNEIISRKRPILANKQANNKKIKK